MASLSDFKVNVTAAPTPSQARLSGDYAKPNKAKPASTSGRCTDQNYVPLCVSSGPFTDVTQYEKIKKITSIVEFIMRNFRKSTTFHRNALQTCINIGPLTYHVPYIS